MIVYIQFRVSGLGFSVQGLGLAVLRPWGLGLGFRAYSPGLYRKVSTPRPLECKANLLTFGPKGFGL